MTTRRVREVAVHRLGAEPPDEEAYAACSPAERLAMMWTLARSAWAFTGEEPRAESRLSRRIVRVQRRGS